MDGIYKKISNKARKLSKNGAVGRLSGMRTDDDNFLKGGNEFRDRDQSVSRSNAPVSMPAELAVSGGAEGGSPTKIQHFFNPAPLPPSLPLSLRSSIYSVSSLRRE